MKLPFIKMNGLGNDFVVVDDLSAHGKKQSPLNPESAKRICDRRFGVGADQILWVLPPEGSEADARMEVLNADGSSSEMCGNGLRAVALYLKNSGPRPGRKEYKIETPAGIHRASFEEGLIRIQMGTPQLLRGFNSKGEDVEVRGPTGRLRRFQFFEVSMGNPHAVIFLPHDEVHLETFGPLIEKSSLFPQRTNVEIVQVNDPGSIAVAVWERGAGVTLACGSGACASAAAAIATGQVGELLTVHLKGGPLRVEWKGGQEPLFMTGPAAENFRGEMDLDLLLSL